MTNGCKILLLSTSSSVKLNENLKKLIDSRKYNEAIHLFRRQSEFSTDRTIEIALKLSTKLRDQQLANEIHQRLSATLLKNSRIQSLLIESYSK